MTRRKMKIRLCRWALLAAILGLWEVGARTKAINPFFFSQPSAVVAKVVAWFSGTDIYRHLGVTLTETILAFVIGTVLGVVLGMGLALMPTTAEVLDPFIKAANAIPRIVLAPIFTLWFGLGILSKVALGVTLVFFVAFFNTYQGVREVNPAILANARILGASDRHLLGHVYLPSAMSWILSSLRASIGFAVVGAIVGEYLGAASGLGYLIHEADSLFDATGVFAGMVVLTVFVLVLDVGVSLLERRLLVWHPKTNATQGT